MGWRLVLLTIFLAAWLIEASPRPQEDEYDEEYDLFDRNGRRPPVKKQRGRFRGEVLTW
jgi:hypothetical protein